MAYTVKQLAKLAKISVRTLHFYHKKGLLLPAYCGANGYRYYSREQLLLLQQILFYRELGLSLDDIKKVITSSDFDKLNALQRHRQHLTRRLKTTRQLIKTIDKTIATLTGETNMNDAELYYGFDSEQQKTYETQLITSGRVSAATLEKAKDRTSSWNKLDWQTFQADGNHIHEKMIAALHQDLSADSPEVQAIIKEHFDWIKKIWTPNKESYIGLSELYQTPPFQKFYHHLDPNLLNYLVKAMQVFASKQLD